MLDPKEGKNRTCILAKRHLSIFLRRNYSNGDNTAVSLELQSGYRPTWPLKRKTPRCAGQRTGRGMRKAQEW